MHALHVLLSLHILFVCLRWSVVSSFVGLVPWTPLVILRAYAGRCADDGVVDPSGERAHVLLSCVLEMWRDVFALQVCAIGAAIAGPRMIYGNVQARSRIHLNDTISHAASRYLAAISPARNFCRTTRKSNVALCGGRTAAAVHQML